MRSIFSDPGRAALEFSPQERVERLYAASSEQHAQALLFLSGYAPAVFDAALDAACGERAGIFLRLGLDWRHYRGEEPGGPFEIFDPGHQPTVTWRPAAGISAAA